MPISGYPTRFNTVYSSLLVNGLLRPGQLSFVVINPLLLVKRGFEAFLYLASVQGTRAGVQVVRWRRPGNQVIGSSEGRIRSQYVPVDLVPLPQQHATLDARNPDAHV